MTLLEQLRAHPTPRPSRLQNKVANCIDGRFGFAVIELIYVVTVVNVTAFTTVMVLRGHGASWFHHGTPTWYVALEVVAATAAAVLVYIPFARWVKRRRAPSRELGERGELCDPVGTRIPVLYAAGIKRALYFTDRGHGCGAAVAGGG